MNSPDRKTRRLVSALGLTSLALAGPPLLRPDAVAPAIGLKDLARTRTALRAVGARELLHGALLLGGPAATVWTRVAGDAVDLSLLARALRGQKGGGDPRTRAALAVVGAITAADLWVSVRTVRQQHGGDRPGPLELQASITVNRPPGEVYAFWRDLENLPRFMLHLKSVQDLGGGRSRWEANAPLRRRSVRWEATITSEDPGRRIAWRSVPKKADIANSGTVHFAPTPDGRSTEVKVVLHYDVPGGRVGRAVARLLGEEPVQQVRDDLRRLKQVLETGEVVLTESLPEGTDARRQLAQGPAVPPRGTR